MFVFFFKMLEGGMCYFNTSSLIWFFINVTSLFYVNRPQEEYLVEHAADADLKKT